ncbi:kinase-like domain-containing protein [Mycena vulgaris]|nr:kinase-like domain-containing protein [Mycena vulgaris]
MEDQREGDRFVRASIAFCLSAVNLPLISPDLRRERFVASGGTATVSSVSIAGRKVAIKQYSLNADPRQLSVSRERFLREAAILHSLHHPCILPFLGVLDDPSRLCIVTSWMVNGELNGYLKHHPDAPKRPLARQVTSGLEYLRRQWIVHGDIKGANILVNEHGYPHIADFGSAFVISHVCDSRSSLGNAPQLTGGTCRWMAPELLMPSQSSVPTFESDVFSLGMVLYEVTILKLPAPADSLIPILSKIFSGGHIPFHAQRNLMAVNLAVIGGDHPPRPPHTPDDIWALATACWRADPTARPTISSIVI